MEGDGKEDRFHGVVRGIFANMLRNLRAGWAPARLELTMMVLRMLAHQAD